MKFLRIIYFICVVVISGNVFAQSQRELGQLMRERQEYYFTLSVNQPTEIQSINELCSVDGTDGHTVVCYANQQQYDRLLQAGYQPNLQTPPSLREEAKMWAGGDRATYEWDSYPTYEQYENMMQNFGVIKRDRVCTYMELGTLSSGRKIMGIRLNDGHPEGKPKFLYTSTMHGDEVTGMILMLRLINEFCTSTDSRIVNILNNVDLFIFPCTNPDGTYYGGNSTVSGARRYNGNGYDLNRHFPDFDDGAHPDGASYYQDEAQWMMDLAQEYLFTMGANYHGGSELMNYPWDTYQPLHPDDAWWQYVSREYANLAQSVSSSYMTDENNGITNGYAWYTITGSRQDYMNYYGQCREVTIECSTQKTPNASTMPNYWNYNHNAMLTYIEECLNGIHGVVYDANTNQTIEGATITVLNHDALGSSVTSHAVGDFHRPIKGGNWTIKVTKDGYCSQTMDVTVSDGQRVDLDVYLYPTGSCPVAMECYEQTIPTSAGTYVMGYLNGSNLVMPTHNSNSTVNATSVDDVTTTDNGFSVEVETLPGLYTLTAYGNDQYYISYNGRYLARSNYGGSLTWGTSQSTRWYINTNGIYTTSNNRNYYLYYNGSFTTSNTQQNNITFYVQGECSSPATYTINASSNPSDGGSITGTGYYVEGATCTLTATANEGYTFINWTESGEEVSTEATYSFEVGGNRTLVANFEEVITTVTQTSTFNTGWTWWTPNVDMDGATLLYMLEQGLGDNGIKITAQDGKSVSYVAGEGWGGRLTSLEVGKMYQVKVSENCNMTLEGPAVDLATHSITLVNGINWIGFFGTESMSVNAALANLQATEGDKISAQNGTSATYVSGEWGGRLQTLEPGQAYIYNSKANGTVTFMYSSSK